MMLHGFGFLGLTFGVIKVIAGVVFLYFVYDISRSLRKIADNMEKNKPE